MRYLDQPVAEWMPQRLGPDGKRMLDVLIIGGGMCGVAAALHLRRLGIHNIRIIDAASAGDEGPWRTFARMETLRSPKHLTGPASGMANLTFRAWFEAQHGEMAWAPLGNIPREMWADYLAWFARVTGAAIDNGVRASKLEPVQGAQDPFGWTVHLEYGSDHSQRETAMPVDHARFVVLATGREHLARPRIPEPFQKFHLAGVDHTGEAPSRDEMRGKDVVVIGLGASAFDYAAEALEGGARHVRIIGRSPTLSRVNKGKHIAYPGFVHGFPLLSDEEKMDFLEHVFERGIAPPRGTVQRVMRHHNVELLLDAPVTNIERLVSGAMALETPVGIFQADRVILGTGYRVDVNASRLLACVAPEIRCWRDAMPERPADGELCAFPYLGQSFEFLPRDGDARPGLERLLCFNHAAMMSLGNLANDIPAVSEGADRLARGVAAALFLADKDVHVSNLHQYKEPELMGDEVPGLNDWWPEVE